MSIDPSPPAQPPQMSPDKKWFWDGAKWQPIPVHEAAFPNWKGLGSGFTPEAAGAAPAPLPLRPSVIPTPAYRMAGPAPDVAVPRWSSPPKRGRIGLYALGAVGLVLVVALVSVFATLALSSKPAAPRVVATKPAPGPTIRSDAAWAAWLVKTLTQPMADLKDTTSETRTACVAGMTSSCADNVLAIGNHAAAILPVLEKATIPLCISAQETKLHTDLGTLNAGSQLAYKGFVDNKKTEFSSGMGQINGAAGLVQSDFAAMGKSAPGCDSALSGP